MPDTVTTAQLYPPASTQAAMVVVHWTGSSDGTGESGVKKLDITTLLNLLNKQPGGLRIEQIRWAIQGYTSILIAWDRTAGANTAMILAGSGYEDFRGMVSKASGVGGVSDLIKLGGLPDPSAGNADNKGSLLLTSNGAVSGATYDITVWCRLEPN